MTNTNVEDLKHRIQIIETEGNTLVFASAGTGKTQIIIDKISHLIKYTNMLKKIAAITYTDKAAIELMNRLIDKGTNDFVTSQTLHKWVLYEILDPFIRNCYTLASNLSLKFVFNSNKKKIVSFEQGIEWLITTGEILSYENRPKYINQALKTNLQRNMYSNEGRDFAFQLALKVLRESRSAQNYLKATYSWIFIDEYQDVNKDQHALIEFIVGYLGIRVVVVGDNKQQIYSFRGSNAKYLESFMKSKKFQVFELTHNFRSNKEIIAYSRLFDDGYNFKSGYVHSEGGAVVNLNPAEISIKEIVSGIRREYPYDSILILKRKNRDILELKKSDNVFNSFQTKINLTYSESTHADLFSLLIKILYRVVGVYELKKYIDDVLLHNNFSKLNGLVCAFSQTNDIECALKFTKFVVSLSDIKISEYDWELFQRTFKDDDQIKYLLENDTQYMILTVHSSKGLEADHIIFDPSEFVSNGKLDQQVHYVAITRAKKRLWLIHDSETYRTIVANLIEKDSILPLIGLRDQKLNEFEGLRTNKIG